MLNVGKMSGNEHLQMCVLPPQISIFKKIFFKDFKFVVVKRFKN